MTARRGFSVVEVLVAVVILGVSSLGLVGMSVSSSRRGNRASAEAYRTTFLQAEFARATAIPTAAAIAGTTCDSTTSAPFVFRRCTRVTNLTSRTQQVAVIITPVDNILLGPDSLVITRASNVGALDFGGSP